ncbi:hypothetical protein EBB07_15765 [Paenibacillaceae bacterium]|nr:hypothetical protein EBB07_15765 [Paenibacillaceae bacterium]
MQLGPQEQLRERCSRRCATGPQEQLTTRVAEDHRDQAGGLMHKCRPRRADSRPSRKSNCASAAADAARPGRKGNCPSIATDTARPGRKSNWRARCRGCSPGAKNLPRPGDGSKLEDAIYLEDTRLRLIVVWTGAFGGGIY